MCATLYQNGATSCADSRASAAQKGKAPECSTETKAKTMGMDMRSHVTLWVLLLDRQCLAKGNISLLNSRGEFNQILVRDILNH